MCTTGLCPFVQFNRPGSGSTGVQVQFCSNAWGLVECHWPVQKPPSSSFHNVTGPGPVELDLDCCKQTQSRGTGPRPMQPDPGSWPCCTDWGRLLWRLLFAGQSLRGRRFNWASKLGVPDTVFIYCGCSTVTFWRRVLQLVQVDQFHGDSAFQVI